MRATGQLNEAQQRRLSITCQYIDKLLGDVEQILHQAASRSPFPRHIVDVTPAQTRILEDYIRRIREQLLRTLAWQDLHAEPPNIPATRAILSHLAFVDIAIEELKPSYMRGSGAVAEGAAEELNGVVHELRSVVQGMERYTRQEFGANLETRLKQLEAAGQDVALMRSIEEIVTRHGFVEFRSRIAMLASRLAENNLEVALFGRVNSGKSSLLNALLNTSVLPVGVNPITAVPTKLRYGALLGATVAFASGRDETVPIEEFRRLITEEGNPGNRRNVVRAVVEVPSARLRQGIVLVDTPGLGSLARRGAAETMAYLPACDLALMLIDAGAALNEEDLGTLRLLYEAGIPALLLLSKADLLQEEGLKSVIAYVERQVEQELRVKIDVHPVSALPEYASLLDRFFVRELLPRFEQAHGLRKSSVARKVGALRESVIAALETSLDRAQRKKTNIADKDADSMEARLRQISGEIGEQGAILDHGFFELAERPEVAMQRIADFATDRICSGGNRNITSAELSGWASDAVQGDVDRVLARTRSAIANAVGTLREIAAEMSRSDMPSVEEAEVLLRDAPRFELSDLTGEIHLGRSKWLGRKIACANAKRALNHSVGPLLKDELHRYGQALRLWSQLLQRKLGTAIGSYADAYRAQLNRMRGGGETGAPAEIERDLAFLTDWNAAETCKQAQQRS
ncbi:MAG: dynamin family protein [Terracidiphilus sp.]